MERLLGLSPGFDLLAEAPRAIPFERTLMGQTSAIKIQAHGPQEYPKWTTKSQTMHTAAQPAAWFVAHLSSFSAKIPAMIKWEAAIPMAPTMRTGFRPRLSTYITAGIFGLLAWIRKDVTVEVQAYRGYKHGDTDDTGGKEADSIAAHAELGEDVRRIVQHCVDTGPLLQKMSGYSAICRIRYGLLSNLKCHGHCSRELARIRMTCPTLSVTDL
jgi:hypothetical protein